MPDLATLGIKVDSRDVKVADANLDSLAHTAGKAEKATKSLGSQVDQNTGFFARNRGAIQNTSYQLTDFATQVQMGTRASVALGQQLPQMLAGFGALGAAMGLVVSLSPTLVDMFMSSSNASKSLESSVDDLYKAMSAVGETAAEFSMDNLYKEYNRANEATRQAIIEQVRFQQTLIDTQRILAQQSLSKSLGDLGQFTTMDRLAGAFGKSPAEKLAADLGVAVDVAKDLLPAINGLRDGSQDASNFIERFGRSLAQSSSGAAQQLVKDIKALADGGRDAAAAQTKLSEALQKMGQAGASGNIAIDDKKSAAQQRLQREELTAAQQELIQSFRDAEKVYEQTRTPLEKLNAEYAKLDRMLELGTINQDTHSRAIAKSIEAYNKASGAMQAWDDSMVEVEKTNSHLDTAMINSFNAVGDAIANFATGGKVSVRDMVNAMIQDFIRLEMRMLSMKMFEQFGGTSGILKSLFGGFTGGAGAIDTSFTTGLGTANYAAVSFDGGGYTGGGNRTGGVDGKGGFPAILHPNETVIDHTKGQTGGVNVSITINSDGTGREESGNGNQAMQLGRSIEASVMSVIMREKRPGGMLA